MKKLTVIAAIFLLLMQAVASAQLRQSYAREVLFRVQLGEGDKQIGVFVPQPGLEGEGGAVGAWGLRVGEDGKIYIADWVNERVKVFDLKGGFLFQSDTAKENIGYLAADQMGHFYVISGAGLDNITKFGPDGKQVWEVHRNEVLPDEIKGYFDGIYPLTEGSFATYLRGAKGNLALFDKNGKYQRVVTGSICNESGKVFTFRDTTPPQKLSLQVKVSSLDGDVLSSYVIKPTVEVASFLKSIRGGMDVIVDSVGYLYTIIEVKSEAERSFGLGLTVHGENFVTRYNAQGKATASVRVPSESLGSSRGNLAVDKNGNLYRLEFQNGRGKTVEVVRYQLK